jgi:DNA-binding NtrC family response regulator
MPPALKILVLDDEPAISQLVSRILNSRGFVTIVVGSCEEAEAILHSDGEGIALLISDVTMPDMSGPVFVQKLRDENINLPVLFMSAHSRDTVVNVPGFGERHFFVQKPFTADEVTVKVQEALYGVTR